MTCEILASNQYFLIRKMVRFFMIPPRMCLTIKISEGLDNAV